MFVHYFPSVIVGVWFSKYKIFEMILNFVETKWKLFICSLIGLLALVLIRLKLGDTIGFLSLITFISPLMILVLKQIIDYIGQVHFIDVFINFLNVYSIYFWLIHSVFHCGIVQIQYFAYLPKLSILILFWVLLIMFPLSYLGNKLIKKLGV